MDCLLGRDGVVLVGCFNFLSTGRGTKFRVNGLAAFVNSQEPLISVEQISHPAHTILHL